MVDYARNLLHIDDADHAEIHPDGAHLAVTPLSCSLVGQEQEVELLPDTRAAAIYGARRTREAFYCNYGLNPAYRDALEAAGLVVSGVDGDGEARIMEMRDHPFFLATLFVPQARSARDRPHPVLAAFAAAARGCAG